MRNFLILIFSFLSTIVFSQSGNFETLLENGKKEFSKDFDKQDYTAAIDNLEKAVKLQPENAEAHYFLGYAYSRLNSKDGKGMIEMNLQLTIKVSEQFELVNKLTPKYNGENVVLDPYSKLTAEWGSMAMSYWHNNKKDSAIWAFNEGKKRGGFGDFYLSINRLLLDFCSENSILISSGDNFTIPLWYLQIVEAYRKDVSVIDISLLNTTWYPAFLAVNDIVQFDLSKKVLDTIKYCKWSDSTFTINNFSWTIKPSYYKQYILRGDRVFLSLLKENNFKRDIYFTTGFNESMRLSLKNHLFSLIIVDKLNTNNQKQLDFKEYKFEITKILSLINLVNLNSQQELNFIDIIRFDLMKKASFYINDGMKEEAKKLIKIMDEYTDEKTYPFQFENGKKYSDYLRIQL